MDLHTYIEKHGHDLLKKGMAFRNDNTANALISAWKTGARPVPIPRCIEIEQVTEGIVTCEELRPDFNWMRPVKKKKTTPKG